MGKLSFLESVRVWLGGIAFDVFLWSVRMSADDYFDMIQTNSGLTPRALDVAYWMCQKCGNFWHMDYHRCGACDTPRG